MVLDLAPKAGGVSAGDVSFAAGIGNRLLQEIGSAIGLKQVGNGSLDGGDRNTLLNGDNVLGEVAVVHDDALWCLAPQPRIMGNGEMDRCGIRVRDPVDCQRCRMRNGDGIGAAICLGPKHGFPVLRELPRRNIGNPVHPSRDSLDSLALDEPSENRIGEAFGARLFSGDESVIFFCQGGEFIEAGAWHIPPFLRSEPLPISFHTGTILTSPPENVRPLTL